jgi:hypothetical protein
VSMTSGPVTVGWSRPGALTPHSMTLRSVYKVGLTTPTLFGPVVTPGFTPGPVERTVYAGVVNVGGGGGGDRTERLVTTPCALIGEIPR